MKIFVNNEKLSKIELKIFETFSEFMEIKYEWEQLLCESNQQNFYVSFDWFYSVLKFSKNTNKELFIVSVEKNRTIIGIAPLVIIKRKFRIFFLNSLEIIGSLYSPHRAFITRKGYELEFANYLFEFLCIKNIAKWDVINFIDLSPKDLSIATLIKLFKERKFQVKIFEQFVNIKTKVSVDLNSEGFFKTLKKGHKQNIRTAINKISRAGNFDIILVKNESQDIETAMLHYYDIYKNSWKEKEEDPGFHGKLAKYLAKKNFLRLFILYFCPNKNIETPKGLNTIKSYRYSINREKQIPKKYIPIASCFFIVYKKHAFFLKTAYREEYKDFSAGNILLWFAIKYLLDEDKCYEIDHQKGCENYKLNWGKIDEKRFVFQAANMICIKAILLFWLDKKIIGNLRKIIRKFKNLSV